jgi:hypothetical protein
MFNASTYRRAETGITDLTPGIKRTLVRPKPDGEWFTFKVPALTTEAQRLRVNDNTAIIVPDIDVVRMTVPQLTLDSLLDAPVCPTRKIQNIRQRH